MGIQECNFCKNPDSIISVDTCCTGCTSLKKTYEWKNIWEVEPPRNEEILINEEF